MKAVSTSRGKKWKDLEHAKYSKFEFRKLLREHYLPIFNKQVERDEIPGQSLKEASARLKANINTNITKHFFERERKAIALHSNLSKAESIKERRGIIKNANAILRVTLIQNHIINNNQKRELLKAELSKLQNAKPAKTERVSLILFNI